MRANFNHINRREESLKSIKDSSIINQDRAINPLYLTASVIDHPLIDHAAASQPLTDSYSMRSAKFLGTPADHHNSDSVTMADTDRHQPSISHTNDFEPEAG